MIQYLQLLLAAKLPQRDERGASAVEYGLLIAGVAVAVGLVVFLLGDAISGLMTEMTADISGDEAPAGGAGGTE